MAQRVLIVDDERSIRLTLTQTITGMGLEAGAAETGESALEHLAGSAWDLVLLDLRLPGSTAWKCSVPRDGGPAPPADHHHHRPRHESTTRSRRSNSARSTSSRSLTPGRHPRTGPPRRRPQPADEQATGYTRRSNWPNALSERAWDTADQHLPGRYRRRQTGPRRSSARDGQGDPRRASRGARQLPRRAGLRPTYNRQDQPRTGYATAQPGPNLRDL